MVQLFLTTSKLPKRSSFRQRNRFLSDINQNTLLSRFEQKQAAKKPENIAKKTTDTKAKKPEKSEEKEKGTPGKKRALSPAPGKAGPPAKRPYGSPQSGIRGALSRRDRMRALRGDFKGAPAAAISRGGRAGLAPRGGAIRGGFPDKISLIV